MFHLDIVDLLVMVLLSSRLARLLRIDIQIKIKRLCIIRLVNIGQALVLPVDLLGRIVPNLLKRRQFFRLAAAVGSFYLTNVGSCCSRLITHLF
jgi:hypothetical protein